jgi:6-phospho-3-hexuloisomerase
MHEIPTAPESNADTSAAATSILRRANESLAELASLLGAVDGTQLDELAARVAASPIVYLDAQGRSGLMSRAVAMRLMHLGMTTHVVGETLTPAIGAGDLLIAVSASGATPSTVEHARVARAVGATVAAITTGAETPLARIADMIVVLPARTVIPTSQHAGSLFEQSLLVVGDALCGALQRIRERTDDQLATLHANLL